MATIVSVPKLSKFPVLLGNQFTSLENLANLYSFFIIVSGIPGCQMDLMVVKLSWLSFGYC